MNDKAKHTPGPWKQCPHRPQRILGNDHIVSKTMYWLGSEDASEVNANAKLIAAAPLMYKKLKVSYQTVRNLAMNLPRGDLRTIAENEAHSIHCVLMEAEGNDE